MASEIILCVVFIAHFFLIAGFSGKQKVQSAVTLIYGEIKRVISYGGDKSNKKVNSGRDTFIILTCKYHASEITLFAFTAAPRWINDKSRHAYEAIFTVSRLSNGSVQWDATILTTFEHFLRSKQK